MPASTGTQGRKETSQRGVMPDHCGRVFVALASWRAPDSLKVRRISGSAVIDFPRGHGEGRAPRGRLGCEASARKIFANSSGSEPSMDILYYVLDCAAIIYLEHLRHIQRLL